MASTPVAAPAKKGKAKKTPGPEDAAKQLQETISKLEKDQAGGREQEIEIEREVKRANRDLTQELSGYNDLARIDAVQKKYTALLTDMKRLERDYQKSKKRADTLQKEKDAAKSELNKTTSLKEKLEKLSRETSNENRKLRAEAQRLQDHEARLREDLHTKLRNMALDVEDVINAAEQQQEQGETFETDELFKQKFKSFVDQYDMRELHFSSLLRQKELEIQVQQAMLDQQRKAQEMESSKSHQLTRQVTTFSQTETELRSQLNIYVEKFKQVEDTLNNSNDLFLTFRREMEEMSKKTKRLEKENLTLTRKHEATNQNILKMAEERTKTQRELEVFRKKNENLEKLCRGMQAQGRGQIALAEQDDEDGTESEYDEEDYDDEGSEEYDDDTEEEQLQLESARRTFGPPPPPPQALANGANGAVNGQKGRHIGQLNGIKA
ncbi:hypothetical protein EJ08DRAFT_590124 [Tothia fuscella]|uniref:Alpha-taxilin n=1 Tax=Tothia fuscella TaxID=1048955 RepID=A0A9P4NPY3_9PEZI|nr:hypothetical protein EJ08DRAFT_590124 [Tothia fuscella]